MSFRSRVIFQLVVVYFSENLHEKSQLNSKQIKDKQTKLFLTERQSHQDLINVIRKRTK